MYRTDHAPPHFHEKRGDAEVAPSIETLAVVWGAVPRRVQALILERAMLHRPELRESWERARWGTPLQRIAPLREVSNAAGATSQRGCGPATTSGPYGNSAGARWRVGFVSRR